MFFSDCRPWYSLRKTWTENGSILSHFKNWDWVGYAVRVRTCLTVGLKWKSKWIQTALHHINGLVFVEGAGDGSSKACIFGRRNYRRCGYWWCHRVAVFSGTGNWFFVGMRGCAGLWQCASYWTFVVRRRYLRVADVIVWEIFKTRRKEGV